MKGNNIVAKIYLKLGLNPVPVHSGTKEPARKKHNTTKMTEKEIDYYKDWSNLDIGISTGTISGGIEAIDFDLKNSEDPESIMKMFKEKVPKELLKKLVVQRTVSGGYHMIYKCEDVSSSKKLAKSADGKAVIETRGEGGYIKCYPSEGYETIQGSLEKIPIITPEERLSIFISAKMLSRTLIKEANKRATTEDSQYLKKFPEYNNSYEIGLDLLEKHGWSIKSEDSEWFNLTRPDSTSGDIHAGYNKEGLFLFVFSTAQDVFEVERPYNNHAIYAELECKGNYPQAYAKLFEEGHGGSNKKIKSEIKIAEKKWEESLESLSFLSDEIEENDYLEQARKDEIEQGLTTGWKALDNYFRFKLNSFNMGLGYDGVGKSLFTLSLAAASNVLHDWKWGMIMPENRTAMSRRRLIECMSGKGIKQFKTRAREFDDWKHHTREAFKIISNKRHYSIKDVISMGKRLFEYYGITALLIDPYNFFKVTGDGYSHNNDILSELRVFSEEYCSVYVMAHPSSSAPRNNKGSDGYLTAPSKYSIQGGADFPYRVDDFFVTHRIVNHEDPDMRKTMQVIMEKVKENETGGGVHNSGEWSELMWESRDGFLGYWDEEGNNPMYKATTAKMGVREQLRRMSPEEAF